MKKANISECANPECERKFERMGTGKVFVHPAKKEEQGTKQKALWLCENCLKTFELQHDEVRQEFVLVRRQRIA